MSAKFADPKHYQFKWDSVEELMSLIDKPVFVNEGNRRQWDSTNRYTEPDWLCNDRRPRNRTEVLSHLRNPMFPDGVERIETMAKKLIAPTPTSRRRKPRRGDAGDDLDMDRVWQGDLEHAWTYTKREVTVGPARILIVVNIGANGSVESTAMARRGTAALALCTALTAAGYTVAVVAANDSELIAAGNPRYSMELTLVPAGGEIDIHKLASMVASPLLFRGVVMMQRLLCASEVLGEGIGRSNAIDPETVDTSGFDYVAIMQDTYNMAEAQSWVNAHLAAIAPQEV